MPPRKKRVYSKKTYRATQPSKKDPNNETPKHHDTISIRKRQIINELSEMDASDSPLSSPSIKDTPDAENTEESDKENHLKETDYENNNESLSKSRYPLRSLSRTDSLYKENIIDKTCFQKSGYTPFHVGNGQSKGSFKTPKSKSQFKTPKLCSAVTDFKGTTKRTISARQRTEWIKQTLALMNKTLKISYLSTMTNFHYRGKNFKKMYEGLLSEKIAFNYPSYKLGVKISTSSVLTQNEKAVDMLSFQVSSLVFDNDLENGKEVIVYEAFLIKSDKVQSHPLPMQDWFPLMLHAGHNSIHHSVINWLQSSFGCYVTPKYLPQGAITWLSCAWSHVKCKNKSHYDFKDQKVTFRYLVRPSDTQSQQNADEKLSILMKCKASDLKNIWDNIIDDDNTGLTSEEIVLFNESMDDFLHSILHIPKALLKLSQMSNSCVSITRDGRIKLFCHKKLASMIYHLIEVYQVTCDYQMKDDDFDINEEEEDEIL